VSAVTSEVLASNARRKDVSIFEVLRYIRSTFDDEDVLDSVPLEAAGNPGAWHAWKTHRIQMTSPGAGAGSGTGAGSGIGAGKALPPEPGAKGGGGAGAARKPGEWNWEGVWAERVKRAIAASLSEGVLYGNAVAADEVVSLTRVASSDGSHTNFHGQINFLNMDESEVEGAKKTLLRTLGTET
jgi:hypothetical protein